MPQPLLTCQQYKYRNATFEECLIYKLGNITIHSENGEIHRLDGPAVLTDITQEWHKNKLYHRQDGPARLFKTTPDGKKFVAEWWFHGEFQCSWELAEENFMRFWSNE